MRSQPKAVRDVIAGDDEIAPGLVDPAQHDAGVWVVGVPVVDRHPVKPGAEVRLHAAHEVTGERLKVTESDGVFGRDNEPELVPVIADAALERLCVRDVPVRRVGPARLTSRVALSRWM